MSTINPEDYMLPALQKNVYKSAAIPLDAIADTFSRESTQNKDFLQKYALRKKLHREYNRSLDSISRGTQSYSENYSSFTSPMEHSLSRPAEAKALTGKFRNKPKKNSMAKGLRSFGKRVRSVFIW